MVSGMFFNCTYIQLIVILTIYYSYQGLASESISSPPRNTSAENLLKQCYNSQFQPSGTLFNEYLDGQPTRSLYLHRVWWSTKQAEFPLSFFTMCDLNRITALQEQCKSLPGGTVAAAIWLPLSLNGVPEGVDAAAAAEAAKLGPGLSAVHVHIVENATALLDEVFARNEAAANTSCALRLMLLYEIVVQEALAMLMPINIMRNTALIATDSDLVAMLDVDLSANKDLAGLVMRSPQRVTEMVFRAERQHVAWILPAWDVSRSVPSLKRNSVADEALSVSSKEKYRLEEMWKTKKQLFPFALERGYVLGHNATNYDRWFTAQAHYGIEYEEGYEPWFIASRFLTPFFDARFRGYYMNKIVAVRSATRFLNMRVLPDVWIVHRPHEVQVANFGWLEAHKHKKDKQEEDIALDEPMVINGTMTTARDAFFKRTLHFYRVAVSQMNAFNYTPVLDVAVENCRKVLPWWQHRTS
ncbi:hypothetical protein Vretimale_16784 [Volvox reticuliferus]|uniref:Uncharacterized protein n=2 Tax=Volvox reticuliferus TaxID=1737510 RepID=A0A8J4CVX3_9CHLO|nr:hypothetical protein Vretifemale_18564 [Volvox reticuliferus]GIM13711.1 hypothetical protein Vretimale_16784 [Volvox reticuliferus]